jgi:hypothetical protein
MNGPKYDAWLHAVTPLRPGHPGRQGAAGEDGGGGDRAEQQGQNTRGEKLKQILNSLGASTYSEPCIRTTDTPAALRFSANFSSRPGLAFLLFSSN